MRGIILATIATLALVGCNEIDGSLIVTETFTIKSQANFDGGNDWNHEPANLTLAPGDYEMSFDTIGKYQSQLSFKKQGHKDTITIDLPENGNFPTERGLINLQGSKMDQTFNLIGAVETKTTDSQLIRDWEPCIDDVGYVCSNPSYGCTPHSIISGHRPVEYYNRHNETKMALDFTNLDGTKQLGHFVADKSYNTRIYTYRGLCL